MQNSLKVSTKAFDQINNRQFTDPRINENLQRSFTGGLTMTIHNLEFIIFNLQALNHYLQFTIDDLEFKTQSSQF